MPETKPQTVREACLAEALAIVARDGVEHLSLREVARRLGISHQTPYRHFKSRDHLLADLAQRAYHDFARVLERAAHIPDPDVALAAMGRAYLDYAAREPLSYRLMFGTPLPPAADHPDMMNEARHAFDFLVQALERRAADAMHSKSAHSYQKTNQSEIERDALFIWSSLHGFASIRASSAFDTLGLLNQTADEIVTQLLERIGKGLG